MATETQLDLVMRFKDEASAAVDKASKTLGGLQQKAEDMGPTFEKMAGFGTVALGAITAFGSKAIKDFADAEKSSAMLEHAVIGVSGATKEQLKATSDLADALERKGVLDGDNIKQGLAQLSTFGLSNKAVQGLGGALADLAVNQYGVSASGEQLSDTANTIAKALNGQFGVLEKSGIRFTDAQKHAIQFGTEMEKVDAINQGFAQNLKFTNETALGTTEGQMAKAAVQAGNLSEALGAVLAPIVRDLTAKVVPLLEQLQKWIEANPELTKNIVIGAAAIAGLVAIIGTLGLIVPTIISGVSALTALLPLLGAAMTAATGPIGLVILGVAALVAGGVLLYKHWDLVKEKATAIWNAIKDFFVKNWREILVVMTGGLGAIVVLIADNWEKITGAWSAVWNNVKDILVAIMDGAKGVIMGTINWIIDKINGAISLANSAIALANKVPGVHMDAIASVPKLAEGGVVSSPTIAMVGEAGPEAIVPLSKMGGGGMGGTQITINVGNLWGANPQAAAREMGDLIIKQLQQNRRIAT